MGIDRIGGVGSQGGVRGSDDLSIARAAAAHRARVGLGAAQPTTDAEGELRSVVARAAQRLAGLTALTERAAAVESALSETHGLLDEIRGMLRAQESGGAVDRDGLAAARKRLAEIGESIRTAEARAASGLPGPGDWVWGQREGFRLTDVNGVVRVDGTATLPPRATRDIELEVLTSAHTGEVELSFYNTTDPRAANASFTIEIAGANGTEQLTFVSGTTVADIAAAINFRTDATGVRAYEFGSTVTLSAPIKDDAFVSVRMLEETGLSGFIRNPYTFQNTNFSDAEPDDVFRDDSSELAARINGVDAQTDGYTVISKTDEWNISIGIGWYLNTHGTFHLFTMQSTAPPTDRTLEEPPLPVVADAIAAGGAAIAQASGATGSAAAVDASISEAAARRDALRELLRGPLADARASAEASLAGAMRAGVRTGWRIDTQG